MINSSASIKEIADYAVENAVKKENVVIVGDPQKLFPEIRTMIKTSSLGTFCEIVFIPSQGIVRFMGHADIKCIRPDRLEVLGGAIFDAIYVHITEDFELTINVAQKIGLRCGRK